MSITGHADSLDNGKALRGITRGKVDNMAGKPMRGSDRLIDAYKNRGLELGDELVRRLSDSLKEFDIHDVLIKGIPHPDILRAGFSVSGEDEAGKALQRVLSVIKDVPLAQIRLFPKGIPWPDIYNVEVLIEQH